MRANRWLLASRIAAALALAFLLALAVGLGGRAGDRGLAAVAGVAMAALSLLALDRQILRRRAAEARERRARAEAAQAVAARVSAEQARARAEEALRAGTEARRRADEGAIQDRERATRARQALRAAETKAEAASRARDQLLGVVSHELRSPLHVMMGWLSILKSRAAAGRDVERAVATIERSVQHQARLVDDLLDVSRLMSGKLSLEDEEVDLVAVVRGAVEGVRADADAKGVSLHCEVAGPAGRVIGDERRLRQMIENLLGNAVKFTPGGGRVTVTLDTRTGSAELSVRDTGMGIAAEILPHVFERFRMTDGSTIRPHGGLGVGLTLVKGLAELHRGRVEVRSEGAGKGATFALHLPWQPGTALIEAAPSSCDVPVAPRELAGVTVVLVEDDPDGREALLLALEQAGAQVQAFASAEQARRGIERCMPDLIVSDIGMPGEDGYSLLRALRASGTAVPAVAITGFASKQDRAEALAAGFDDHVPKPVDADALIAKMRELSRRSGPRWREPMESYDADWAEVSPVRGA